MEEHSTNHKLARAMELFVLRHAFNESDRMQLGPTRLVPPAIEKCMILFFIHQYQAPGQLFKCLEGFGTARHLGTMFQSLWQEAKAAQRRTTIFKKFEITGRTRLLNPYF